MALPERRVEEAGEEIEDDVDLNDDDNGQSVTSSIHLGTDTPLIGSEDEFNKAHGESLLAR